MLYVFFFIYTIVLWWHPSVPIPSNLPSNDTSNSPSNLPSTLPSNLSQVLHERARVPSIVFFLSIFAFYSIFIKIYSSICHIIIWMLITFFSIRVISFSSSSYILMCAKRTLGLDDRDVASHCMKPLYITDHKPGSILFLNLLKDFRTIEHQIIVVSSLARIICSTKTMLNQIESIVIAWSYWRLTGTLPTLLPFV